MLNLEAGSYYDADTAGEAQITLAEPTGQAWSIAGFAYSLMVGDTASGTVLSSDAKLIIWSVDTTGSSNIIFGLDLGDTAATYASGSFVPSEPVKFPSQTAIIIELASGGTGVVGKLNVLGAKRV